MDTPKPAGTTETVPFMDEDSQRRALAIGKRIADLGQKGWELMYRPQDLLGGISVKAAADLGKFAEIEALLDRHFPTHVLIPVGGSITQRDGTFDIEISIQPFQLDGETVSTQLHFEGITLPLDGRSAWKDQSFTFPASPAPGYIDGSFYLRNAHNPADLTSLAFGAMQGNAIEAALSITILFEHEGVGFFNTRVALHAPLEICAA